MKRGAADPLSTIIYNCYCKTVMWKGMAETATSGSGKKTRT